MSRNNRGWSLQPYPNRRKKTPSMEFNLISTNWNCMLRCTVPKVFIVQASYEKPRNRYDPGQAFYQIQSLENLNRKKKMLSYILYTSKIYLIHEIVSSAIFNKSCFSKIDISFCKNLNGPLRWCGQTKNPWWRADFTCCPTHPLLVPAISADNIKYIFFIERLSRRCMSLIMKWWSRRHSGSKKLFTCRVGKEFPLRTKLEICWIYSPSRFER